MATFALIRHVWKKISCGFSRDLIFFTSLDIFFLKLIFILNDTLISEIFAATFGSPLNSAPLSFLLRKDSTELSARSIKFTARDYFSSIFATSVSKKLFVTCIWTMWCDKTRESTCSFPFYFCEQQNYLEIPLIKILLITFLYFFSLEINKLSDFEIFCWIFFFNFK